MRQMLTMVAVAAMATGGFAGAAEEYWMWGHHPDSFDVAAAAGEKVESFDAVVI